MFLFSNLQHPEIDILCPFWCWYFPRPGLALHQPLKSAAVEATSNFFPSRAFCFPDWPPPCSLCSLPGIVASPSQKPHGAGNRPEMELPEHPTWGAGSQTSQTQWSCGFVHRPDFSEVLEEIYELVRANKAPGKDKAG